MHTVVNLVQTITRGREASDRGGCTNVPGLGAERMGDHMAEAGAAVSPPLAQFRRCCCAPSAVP
jgi:hypothetical protein